MRAVFGVVSLLVALAVVAFVAKTQVRHVASSGAALGPAPTVAGQAHAIEEKARADVARALQEGARRTEDADR